MKIHEFQAKELLSDYNVPIQRGHVVYSANEIEKTIDNVQNEFNSDAVVVKAQIHAGGRGKGGGVKFCPSTESAIESANEILGMNLITHQTGEEGKLVNQILITEALDIEKEFYFALMFDRAKNADVFIVSTEGGVDIEEVAEKTPEKIVKAWVNNDTYPLDDAINTIINALTLNSFNDAFEIFKNIYNCYSNSDCNLLEINPLVITEDQKIIALDAKVDIDSNALFRQEKIAKFHDTSEEDPLELKASEYGLNYIKLDGNVGCMVNGAGLAMATMDIIKLAGGEPANFLDVGGTASSETVKNGFKIILSDKNVKAILINIFGGIVRCDRVANGVVQAVKELGLNVPVVVRLEGTNAEDARSILKESGVSIIPALGMKDAAEKVVNAAINIREL